MKPNLVTNIETPVSTLIHNSRLDIYNQPSAVRKTRIICTIGPSSRSVDMLAKLMECGMDIVRMNFSHGTHEYHSGTTANAREAAKRLNRDVTIALDTKGPEIRTGNFLNDKEVMLEIGKKVKVTVNDEYINKGTADMFYIDYKNLVKVVQPGNLIYIDDGNITLKITEKGNDYVDCIVLNSGAISNHKGCNLPNVNVDLPTLSEQDKKDLELGVKLQVDMIFASFIRSPDDVDAIRKTLCAVDPVIGKRIQIISKIENHQGMRHFDEILEKTDGVMVARGDLGVEVAPEKVFLAQKMMVSKCNIRSKPIIVATQMLESMTKNPRPTRAEVSDVANAVLDGADCVMLSGETAKGLYPTECVQMMARICCEAESARNSLQYFIQIRESLPTPLATPDTIACAAVLASFEQKAKAIIVLTNSGSTGRLISKFRPPCPVVAVVGSSCDYTARQLKVSSGVFPVLYDDKKGKLTADERVKIGLHYSESNNWVKQGDFVVCVHADEMGKGFANLMKMIAV